MSLGTFSCGRTESESFYGLHCACEFYTHAPTGAGQMSATFCPKTATLKKSVMSLLLLQPLGVIRSALP